MDPQNFQALLGAALVVFGGCLSAEPADDRIRVPMPGLGASVTYRVESSGLGWERAYDILALGPMLTRETAVHPGLWIREHTNSAGEEARETTRVFDLATRTWGTLGTFYKQETGFPDPVYGTLHDLVEGSISFAGESLAVGSLYDPVPVSDLTGNDLRDGKAESIFSADFAGFGVSLDAPANTSAASGAPQPGLAGSAGGMIRASYDIRVRGNQATVEVSISGVSATATLVFEDGISFPIRVTVHNDALGHSSMEFRLTSYSLGAEEFSVGEAGASDWTPREREPLDDGIPPEGEGVPLAFPLGEAMNSIRDDPTMAAFRAWRLRHPDSIVAYASLSPWQDSVGRAGLEWYVRFTAPDNSSSVVRSVRILEPPLLAGRIENRDFTATSILPRSEAIDFDALEFQKWVPLGHYVEIAQAMAADPQPLRFATWQVHKDTGCWGVEWDDPFLAGVIQVGFSGKGNASEIIALTLVERTVRPGATGTPHVILPC